MILKIALLAAVAIALWLITRPKKRLRAKDGAGGKNAQKLVQCPRCGVYSEDGATCPCAGKE